MIYDKLLFYSVISNYLTVFALGLIRKTRTVTETELLTGLKKLTYVLCVDSDLFGEDF